MKNYELPCESDGAACDWESQEVTDKYGDIESWDLMCIKCFRWRDWNKDQMPEITYN